MKFSFPALAAVVLSAVFVFPAAGGQLYKWTDASGRVQYSDTPPPNVKAEPVQGSRVGTSSAPAGAAPSVADQEQAFRKRRAEAQEAEQKLAAEQASKDAVQEQCTRAKASLASLQDGGRIYTTNAKGEREYMDQAKIDGEKQRIQKQISENCK